MTLNFLKCHVHKSNPATKGNCSGVEHVWAAVKIGVVVVGSGVNVRDVGKGTECQVALKENQISIMIRSGYKKSLVGNVRVNMYSTLTFPDSTCYSVKCKYWELEKRFDKNNFFDKFLKATITECFNVFFSSMIIGRK